jgi:hypothetical protein
MRDPRCKLTVREITVHLDATFTGYHIANLEIYHSTHGHYLKMIERIDETIMAYMRTMPTSKNYNGTGNNRSFSDLKKPTTGQTDPGLIAKRISSDRSYAKVTGYLAWT